MQSRIAILSIAALFLLFTIILVSIGLHRASEPADVSVPDTTDAQTTVVTEADTTVPPPLEKGITICIDPGHGFDDPGASTEYLGQWTEADVNLAIGLMLRDELVARGYTVIMTHDTNDIPADASPNEQYLFGLAKRTAYANEQKPDFFLSIHADSFEDESVHGSRVYCQTISGADNTDILTTAQCFVDALTASFPDAKKAPLLKPMEDDNAYYVLRNVTMPAVLVEIGFSSNPDDAANMLDEEWQARMAQSLADGIDRNFAQ